MGNILGIITRHYYRPLLPQRRRVARDKVPLMSWSKKGGTLYDDFEPRAKELLLEKDRELQEIQKHHNAVMQQFEKRIRFLEKKIYDLQQEFRKDESWVAHHSIKY